MELAEKRYAQWLAQQGLEPELRQELDAMHSDAETVTDAFYRVDKSRSRAQGGVGLGLSLCSEIVQLHNGTMSFASCVGNGTCVTVELKGGAV